MKRLILILLLLAPSFLFSEEFSLFYENRGSQVFEFSRVEIDQRGEVDVSTKRHNGEAKTYSFSLNPLMMRYLGDVIKSSVLFKTSILPPEDAPHRLHSGVTKLKIEIGSQDYEIHSIDGLRFQSLRGLIGRMINQCEIYWGLVNDGDVYALKTAVSPRSAGRKILNTKVFLVPLVEFIDRSDDYSDIRTGLETLQYMLSPEEFAGFISERLTLDGSEDFWFYAIPSGNLEVAHRKALMPLFLSILVELNGRSVRSEFEQSIFHSLLSSIGGSRYTPAIPFILSLESHYSLPYLNAGIAVLSKMGHPALEHISGIMDSENVNKKLNGCELMLLSARLNPQAEYSYPVSEYEYDRISKYISEHLLPKAISFQGIIPDRERERLAEIISNTQLELEK